MILAHRGLHAVNFTPIEWLVLGLLGLFVIVMVILAMLIWKELVR